MERFLLFSVFSNGYWLFVWPAIPPLGNINLIQIRLAVHKLENETPLPLKSALVHMIQLWKYISLLVFTACKSFCQTKTGMLIGVQQGSKTSYPMSQPHVQGSWQPPPSPCTSEHRGWWKEIPVRCTSKWLIHKIIEKRWKTEDREAVKT